VNEYLHQRIDMRPTYRRGEPVTMTYSLSNEGSDGWALLNWNTPLEGEVFAFAEVRHGDQLIPYDGRLVTRADPGPESYLRLAPSETITEQLDLSASFAFEDLGEYTVTTMVRFHDAYIYEAGADLVGRPRHEHEPLVLDEVSVSFELVAGDEPRLTSGQRVRTEQAARRLADDGGLSGDIPVPAWFPETFQADQNAIDWLGAAEAELASWTARTDNSLYTEWFGADDTGRYQAIQDHYARIRNRLGQPHTYDGSQTGCGAGWYAYTYPGSDTVYICQLWIDAPAVGVDSQFGIFIHEWSHAVDGTKDIAYGQTATRQLALTSPDQAVNNADNHKYLVETLAGRMLTGPVVWNNGKAYFFTARMYYQYDIAADSVDPGYPKPIAGNWPGLWADRIDAAVVWNNGKAYFFRDGEYMRYNLASDQVDPGYPLAIADFWPGLGGDKIDAVAFWPTGKAYFFRGSQYWRYDVGADRTDPGYPLPIAGNWPGVWTEGLTGAVTWPNGKAYLFRGWQYIRYDIAADQADGGYPKAIAENWPLLWNDRVDAALFWPNGQAYFFRDSQYVRYDPPTDRVDPGYPAGIGANWPGLGGDPVDAVVVWPNGKAYFFRGTQYWRYDIAGDQADDGYPLDIGQFWPGLGDDPVDAAIVWNNGKAYFFRGAWYWRYDIAADRADDGFPCPIGNNWPGLPGRVR
jgi:hypothetical protein